MPVAIQEVFRDPPIWHTMYLAKPMQLALLEHGEFAGDPGMVKGLGDGDSVQST